MESKPFYFSKTFWVNIIGLAYMLFGKNLGIDLTSTENEAAILGIINIVLRFVTKDPVGLK